MKSGAEVTTHELSLWPILPYSATATLALCLFRCQYCRDIVTRPAATEEPRTPSLGVRPAMSAERSSRSSHDVTEQGSSSWEVSPISRPRSPRSPAEAEVSNSRDEVMEESF